MNADALRLGPVELLIMAGCCLTPLLLGVAAWLAVRFARRHGEEEN